MDELTLYNSAYKGTEIDAAIGAVKSKETIWDNKQNKLAGVSGQIVGFDGDGDAVAMPMPSELPEGGITGQILTQGTDGPEWADAPDTGVTTFNGRTGEVSPQDDDYSANMIKFADGETFQQKYNSGELTGPIGDKGNDGVTFTPFVSEDGIISWTNNGSLANPNSVNIRGPQGEPGADGEVIQQVYIGESEPTDEDVDIWINPSGDTVSVPTKTSDLINDSGFISDESDPTVPSHIKNITQENINSWNGKSDFSGSYNDLTDKPNIPTFSYDSSSQTLTITG